MDCQCKLNEITGLKNSAQLIWSCWLFQQWKCLFLKELHHLEWIQSTLLFISNWSFSINITWLLPLVFGKNIGFSESLIRCQINSEKLLQMIKVASFVFLIGPFGLGKIASSINHEKHFNFPWQSCLYSIYTINIQGHFMKKWADAGGGVLKETREYSEKWKTRLWEPCIPGRLWSRTDLRPANKPWTLSLGHVSEIWSKVFVSKCKERW